MPALRALDAGCAPVSWMELGILATNVYFVEDGQGGVVVVDPADHLEVILEVVGERPVTAIVLTHGHYDHVGAAAALREATGAPVIANAIEQDRLIHPREGYAGRMAPPCKVDRTVGDGDDVQLGSLRFKVIHTPGHTEGSTCYYLDPAQGLDADGKPLLLAGDTLFYGSIGRTDLDGGSMADMRRSLGKLANLPDATIVMPGHNALTTIGTERVRTIDALR